MLSLSFAVFLRSLQALERESYEIFDLRCFYKEVFIKVLRNVARKTFELLFLFLFGIRPLFETLGLFSLLLLIVFKIILCIKVTHEYKVLDSKFEVFFNHVKLLAFAKQSLQFPYIIAGKRGA